MTLIYQRVWRAKQQQFFGTDKSSPEEAIMSTRTLLANLRIILRYLKKLPSDGTNSFRAHTLAQVLSCKLTIRCTDTYVCVGTVVRRLLRSVRSTQQINAAA